MAQYPVKSEHKLIDYFYTDTNSRCETFPSQPFKPVCLLSAQTFKGMETIDQEHLAHFTQNISKYNHVIINVFTWPPSLNKTTLFSIITHFFQQILAECVNLWAQLLRIFDPTNRRKCVFFLFLQCFCCSAEYLDVSLFSQLPVLQLWGRPVGLDHQLPQSSAQFDSEQPSPWQPPLKTRCFSHWCL